MKKGANIMCTVDKVRRTKSAFIVVFVVVFFCAQRERSHLSQSTIKSFEIYASFCAFITDGCFLSLSFSLPHHRFYRDQKQLLIKGIRAFAPDHDHNTNIVIVVVVVIIVRI